MSIIKNRKKSISAALGAAAAAAAAPAMLFLSAGTAHAGGWVSTSPDYLGVSVNIGSDGTTFGNCRYTAIPSSGLGVPVFNRPFHLDPGGFTQLWFPGVRLNTTWNVSVNCDNGAPINEVETY